MLPLLTSELVFPFMLAEVRRVVDERCKCRVLLFLFYHDMYLVFPC